MGLKQLVGAMASLFMIGVLAVTASPSAATQARALGDAGRPVRPLASTDAGSISISAVYELVNAQTRLCLDSNYQGSVYTLACNGGNYQKWFTEWSGSGWRIRNLQTGLCLDSNYQGSVYTLACNGGNYQNWYGDGSRVRNQQTRRCLDSNYQGSVYTLACNGGNYQNWYGRY